MMSIIPELSIFSIQILNQPKIHGVYQLGLGVKRCLSQSGIMQLVLDTRKGVGLMPIGPIMVQ
jgi:hypothetical protein